MSRAGPRAVGAERVLMSDTCDTHRSQVPQRSSGRIRGGVTTVEDKRGPGLGFHVVLFSVCAEVVHEGLPLTFLLCCLYLFFQIKVMFIVCLNLSNQGGMSNALLKSCGKDMVPSSMGSKESAAIDAQGGGMECLGVGGVAAVGSSWRSHHSTSGPAAVRCIGESSLTGRGSQPDTDMEVVSIRRWGNTICEM